VGIVGAGQLGRMLALAAYPLGLECEFLDRSDATPGAQVARSLVGELEDPRLLAELARRSDVLTFDWENIAGAALRPLESLTLIRPPRAALEVSQDRLHEKALFERLKIPVAAHAPVDTLADLERIIARLGLPGVLKTRRLGYDGKGQFVLRAPADIERAWASMGAPGPGAPQPDAAPPGAAQPGAARPGAAQLIYEQFQAFTREVSIVGARDRHGKIVCYPLSENHHAQGILRYGRAPHASAALERSARGHLTRILRALDYIGVLAVEFFVVRGRLVANEMAPRVHNSGHWTIEGCVTSQFENHLRAICDLPLGSTRPVGHTAMINFLGEMPSREALLRIEGLAFHDYGKEPRPGRKLGHCTILRRSPKDRDRALRTALRHIRWS
jgi:5-(carboxyamino)imidazole ribonucleotide synthase